MCSSFCCTLLKGSVKGLCVLLALMIYQVLCFTAFLSLSIGFSHLVAKMYEYFMSPGTFPNAMEAFICMYLITVFSEFHIFCQQECIGAALLAYDRLYHSLLTYGAMFIYITAFLFAFGQLYIQFEAIHLSRIEEEEVKRLIQESPTASAPYEETGFSEYDKLHTAFFLLALSFLMYCTSKLIHYDIIEQMRRRNVPSSCVHCVITIAFFGLHLLVNLLYAIPLFIVAFSLKMYTSNGNMAYVQITFVATLTGIIFAVMETRKPWPTLKSEAPFYLYENNTRAKAILAQVQVIWILVYFYSPNTSGKIMAKDFNAGSDSVIYFCFAVGFNVIHLVKLLVFIWLSKREPAELLDQRDLPLVLLDDDDEPPVIIIPNSELEPLCNRPSCTSSSRTGGEIPDTKDGEASSGPDGSNNNNTENNDQSQPEKSVTELKKSKSVTGPEISELLAVRNATESVSDVKVQGSMLTKSDEQILLAIEKIEKAINVRKPFDINILKLTKEAGHKSEDQLHIMNSVCTQTEEPRMGFLAVGIEGDDSEIWAGNGGTGKTDDRGNEVTLVIGNISEDDLMTTQAASTEQIVDLDEIKEHAVVPVTQIKSVMKFIPLEDEDLQIDIERFANEKKVQEDENDNNKLQ